MSGFFTEEMLNCKGTAFFLLVKVLFLKFWYIKNHILAKMYILISLILLKARCYTMFR